MHDSDLEGTRQSNSSNIIISNQELGWQTHQIRIPARQTRERLHMMHKSMRECMCRTSHIICDYNKSLKECFQALL